ncbi:MAG TPA: sensor histidine kinase [Hydrogenophaga sp.]|nr:sensor histidine kinase [Hydrogenophaga sp.]HMN93913.1 sensor histidine kinase [Hydrogenophaga sp.]
MTKPRPWCRLGCTSPEFCMQYTKWLADSTHAATVRPGSERRIHRDNAQESTNGRHNEAIWLPCPGRARKAIERKSTVPAQPAEKPARPPRKRSAASPLAASDESARLHQLAAELNLTREQLRLTQEQLEHARAEFARVAQSANLPGKADGIEPQLQRALQDRTNKLRSLTSALVMAEERERRALAQDLHDDLGQMIALIRLKLSALAALDMPAVHRRALADCTATVDETHRKLRAMTFQLYPPMLHGMGLVPSLEWLADEIRHAYRLQVRVHDDGESKPLDPSVTATLFRAVRELLINVARHAKVQRADVFVKLQQPGDADTRLLITVSDAGAGFDPKALEDHHTHRGFGLISVRERLDHLGGSMHVVSHPGDGTTVTLSVPLLATGTTTDTPEQEIMG